MRYINKAARPTILNFLALARVGLVTLRDGMNLVAKNTSRRRIRPSGRTISKPGGTQLDGALLVNPHGSRTG